MKVVNVHQRLLHASCEEVDAVLATLGSPHDKAWPGTGWPRMILDRPLAVGARGGHGPIRYVVESREPGFAAFRFTNDGVDGWHAFEILEATAHHCVLEHRIEAQLSGASLLKWVFIVRPLHDACVEDALSQVQMSLGLQPPPRRWSWYVRLLMHVLRNRRRGAASGRARHAG